MGATRADGTKRNTLGHRDAFRLYEAFKAMTTDIERERLSKAEVVERLSRDLKLDLTDDHINKAAKVVGFRFKPTGGLGKKRAKGGFVNGTGYHRLAVLEAHADKIAAALKQLGDSLGVTIDVDKPVLPTRQAPPAV